MKKKFDNVVLQMKKKLENNNLDKLGEESDIDLNNSLLDQESIAENNLEI